MASNNQINAPIPFTVAKGGTGVITLTTAYGVLCAGTTATGAVQTLASLGASGTVLTSNGAGALPSFQTNTGGSGTWVLVATASASASATVEFTNDFTSTYDCYAVVLSKVEPATDAVYLTMQVGTGAGPSWVTSGTPYSSGNFAYYGGATTATWTKSDAQNSIYLSSTAASILLGNATGENFSGIIYVQSPADTGEYTTFFHNANYTTSATQIACNGGAGTYKSTTAVTSLRFLMSSGNITSGEFWLYGIKPS